jgi:hypothetical protein
MQWRLAQQQHNISSLKSSRQQAILFIFQLNLGVRHRSNHRLCASQIEVPATLLNRPPHELEEIEIALVVVIAFCVHPVQQRTTQSDYN